MKKSSTCFFLKLLPIKVLQKFCMYSIDSKERELKRELKPPSLADYVQQLLHQNNCKIDPCGIEFAMMTPCPHGFGDVVARGLNLCLPLWSQNCEFAAPGSENCLAANKHLLRVGWRNFFSSCAIVSVFFVVAGNSFRCYLPIIPVVPLCLVAQVSFSVVAGKGFRCYLLTDHTSCAIVSVFWFWQ